MILKKPSHLVLPLRMSPQVLNWPPHPSWSVRGGGGSTAVTRLLRFSMRWRIFYPTPRREQGWKHFLPFSLAPHSLLQGRRSERPGDAVESTPQALFGFCRGLACLRLHTLFSPSGGELGAGPLGWPAVCTEPLPVTGGGGKCGE